MCKKVLLFLSAHCLSSQNLKNLGLLLMLTEFSRTLLHFFEKKEQEDEEALRVKND